MDDENDSAVLEAHVGTRSPCWRLGSDSNALELAAVRGLTNVAVALTGEQAERIRALTGVTSHLVLDITLFGARHSCEPLFRSRLFSGNPEFSRLPGHAAGYPENARKPRTGPQQRTCMSAGQARFSIHSCARAVASLKA